MSSKIDVSALTQVADQLASYSGRKALNTEKLTRTVAVSMLTVISKRIFMQGLNANGQRIGTYNPDYYKQRLKKYGRSNKNITFIASGHMANDFSTGVTPTKDGYGMGFAENSDEGLSHYQLAGFLEERFGFVWSMTAQEEEQAFDIAEQFIYDSFKA